MSASWAVPANATSGIYFARLVRTDTGGASHIVFVVRDDASHSDILFQTSDTTWQAYNDYGGQQPLQRVRPGLGRAYKVSYNRPFSTRAFEPENWVFNGGVPDGALAGSATATTSPISPAWTPTATAP